MNRIVSGFSTDSYLQRIVDVVAQSLRGKHASIYLFGSRAEGRANDVSDYDIAIDAEADEMIPIHKIREELEESTIPYKVDVVDLRCADESLKNTVREKGVLLWKR